MTATVTLNREFLMHLAQFHNTSQEFFQLVQRYPLALVDKSGACGQWSPRETLAYLCGWVAEADAHFSDYDQQQHTRLPFDVDAFNQQNIARRDGQEWRKTVTELYWRTQDLISHAVKSDTRHYTTDPRYQQWLLDLSHEFAERGAQLRQFAAARRA